MTFLELAEKVLGESKTPLTANEIWQHALDKKYDKDLKGQGKTPRATLGAQLYVNAKDNPKTKFSQTDSRPKKFYLKTQEFKNVAVDLECHEDKKTVKNKKFEFLEKDLHPLLSYFAYSQLHYYTKTLNHSSSSKKEFGEWVHPDMVGCFFPHEDWKREVYELSYSLGNTSIKIVSFEIKREISFGNLRESFFQAVSNSSWANEGYLVAALISEEDDFRKELARLSTAFGIGIIHLKYDDVDSSEIILPAKYRETLDWETVNKLAMNPDFKEFLFNVKIDSSGGKVHKKDYESIIDQLK